MFIFTLYLNFRKYPFFLFFLYLIVLQYFGIPVVQLKDRSRVWNTDLLEAVELENLLINAAITVHSAEQRKVRP